MQKSGQRFYSCEELSKWNMKSTVKGVKLNSFFHLLYFPVGSSAPFGCKGFLELPSIIHFLFEGYFFILSTKVFHFCEISGSSCLNLRSIHGQESEGHGWGGWGRLCGLLGVFTHLRKPFSSTSTVRKFASKKASSLSEVSFQTSDTEFCDESCLLMTLPYFCWCGSTVEQCSTIPESAKPSRRSSVVKLGF